VVLRLSLLSLVQVPPAGFVCLIEAVEPKEFSDEKKKIEIAFG